MIFERLAQSVVCKMEQNTENYVYLGHNFYFNLYFSNTSPHRQKKSGCVQTSANDKNDVMWTVHELEWNVQNGIILSA